VRGRYSVDYTSTSYSHTFEIGLRLRELRQPGVVIGGKTVMDNIVLEIEDAVFSERYSSVEPGGHRCRGRGQVRGTQVPIAGSMVVKRGNVDVAPYVGIDLPVGGGTYDLGFFPPNATYKAPCDAPDDWIEVAYVPSRLGRSWRVPWTPTHLSDPEVRYLVGGRMQGSYETRMNTGHHTALAWSLCREGVNCPPPAELPSLPAGAPPTDPCPPPATQKALMDTLWSQRQAYAAELEPKWRELAEAFEEMQFNIEAWRSAVGFCAINDIVAALVGRLSGDFGKAVGQADKMYRGDLSYLTAGLDRNDAAQRQAADLIKAFLMGWKAGTALGQRTDPNAMRSKIARCGVLPDDLRAAANAFVDNYEKIPRLSGDVQELVNHVRNKDQAYWDQWHKYHQACLDWAACEGRPATDCQAPPAEPSGPMQ
jgi:hypothetical protein